MCVFLENRDDQRLKEILKEQKNSISRKINNSININKTIWQVINNETQSSKEKHVNNILLKENGIIIKDPYYVANIFNDSFSEMVEKNVIPYLDTSTHIQNFKDTTINIGTHLKFRSKTIDSNTLIKIIDSFKPKWSAGHDDIPMKIIKEAKFQLLKPLLHVINTSIITGVFPNDLKISKVIPLYKKGEHSDPLNYRPLAMQSSLSKIFEKAMLLQLIDYFENNNLLDVEQHGYRKNKSTITALISYVENVLNNLDLGNNTFGAFLDMTKASIT